MVFIYYGFRVEAIASTTSFDVDFAPLREAINRLQSASLALDQEKAMAEKKFSEALRIWRKHRSIWRVRRKLRHAICNIRRRLGKVSVYRVCRVCVRPGLMLLCLKPCHRRGEQDCEMNDEGFSTPTFIPSWVWEGDLEDEAQFGLNTTLRGKRGRRLARKLVAAAKRVQKANSKLVAFERGFISAGGIKVSRS